MRESKNAGMFLCLARMIYLSSPLFISLSVSQSSRNTPCAPFKETSPIVKWYKCTPLVNLTTISRRGCAFL